jgi:hypothetical protein
MGKTEEEVLPIVTEHEEEKLAALGDLLKAIDETNLPEYKEVLKSGAGLKIKWQLDLIGTGTNTNFLLSHLFDELRRDFTKLGIASYENVFAGVYPTYTFNAQARQEDDGYLILVDTGCFETIEAAVTILLGPWTHSQKTAMFVEVVRDYCHRRKLPRSEQLQSIPSEKSSGLEIARDLQSAEEITPILTNACEKFVIAHEYGHIIRGHFNGGSLTRLGEHAELPVISKDQEQEFEADLWAINTLITQTDNFDARERLITYTGALMVLGMDLLINDCAKKRQRTTNSSHPPALERMSLLQTYYEHLSWNLDFKGSGRIDGTLLRLVSDSSISLGGNGITLDKSESFETLDDQSESARHLAQAFGLSLSSHDRIAAIGNSKDLMSRLVEKMKIDLVAPLKNPFAKPLDEVDKIKRYIFKLFMGLEILLLTAGAVSFYFTARMLLPGLFVMAAALLAAFYFRFAGKK